MALVCLKVELRGKDPRRNVEDVDDSRLSHLIEGVCPLFIEEERIQSVEYDDLGGLVGILSPLISKEIEPTDLIALVKERLE